MASVGAAWQTGAAGKRDAREPNSGPTDRNIETVLSRWDQGADSLSDDRGRRLEFRRFSALCSRGLAASLTRVVRG